MTKYLLGRILRGLLSVVIVVTVVMLLIYTCLDRNLVFANDGVYQKQKSNNKEVYKLQTWEKYGYLDYVPYSDYLKELQLAGKLTEEQYAAVSVLAGKENEDSAETKAMINEFEKKYEELGYDVVRLPGDYMPGTKKYKDGGQPKLYAVKDDPLLQRLWNYVSGLVTVDNIHYVEEDIGDRGLSFTLFDPSYGGEKFSPAIMGNGTRHKYILYFDSSFPYIHQNLFKISLGKSYTVNNGIDVFDTMVSSQGAFKKSTVPRDTSTRVRITSTWRYISPALLKTELSL